MCSKITKITLCYGPNEALGVVKRHPQRLNRLSDALNNLGFQVATEKIYHRDRLIMKLNDAEIFRCRLSYLQYTPDSRGDETLYKAIYAAIEASARFQLHNDSRKECP